MQQSDSGNSRRTFLKQASVAAATPLAAGALSARAFASGDETLRVALVGCGGRGTGAAIQALSTAGDVQLVAMADAFRDRLDSSLQHITNHLTEHGGIERLAVTEESKFSGFDAYKQAIASGVDVVILTTPPGFRPLHFAHAIEQGKHVFMEKPVAVDAPGVRAVLDAGKLATQKGLKVGVGLQRRHETKYLETIQRIRDGAVGDINHLRVYWNGAGVWTWAREATMTEMEYQMRNWYYFNWLCGDHIVEQHIHNLDVGNWLKEGYPVKAVGMGGRQVRTGVDAGEIYDHFAVEYTYADGTKMYSQCRHIPGCWDSVSEHVHGTHGYVNVGAGRIESQGGWKWRFRDENPNPYQVEHDDLFAAIRNNTPFNEAEYGAKSTMTSIFGRMACYSGKEMLWDEAIASEVSLAPLAYDWNGNPPTLPDEAGRYAIPTPGVTKVI